MRKPQAGFTIVELLIVIVVIAILAAISIVAYRGINDRARAATVQSALNQAAKKVALWQADNSGAYPAALADAGVTASDGVSYQYTSSNDSTPMYCITASSGGSSYYVSNSGQMQQGICPGQNLLVWDKTQGTASMPVPGATLDTSVYRTSTASMRIGPGITGRGLRNGGSPFTGTVGQTYTVSLWLRTDSNWNGLGNNSKIRFGDSDGGGLLKGCSYNGVKTTWTQVTCDYTMTAGHTTLSISVGNDGTVGNIWIDDLVLSLS